MLSLFFFHAPATTDIYTLSLHDALPISTAMHVAAEHEHDVAVPMVCSVGAVFGNRPPELRHRHQDDVLHAVAHVPGERHERDRKSTRLNSSHPSISYAVFCLKKKKNTNI